MEILTCKRTLFLYDCGDIEIFLLNEKNRFIFLESGRDTILKGSRIEG